MSEIVISKKINLTEDPNNISPLYVNKLFIGNEPNNELVQYYIVPTMSMQEDKQSKVVLSDYDELSWGNKRRRLTARKISNLGIKTFPTYGAIGFFTYKYGERSMILCPINNNHVKFIAPTISMKNTGTQLEFTITCPDTITYYCYRIIIRQGDFAVEYITYDLKLTVPIPDVKGNYEIFCIGYINEGETISFNSNVISFKVYTGKETFGPDPTISYYTKTEIDELIKSIVKTYTGDNETIDVNQDTGVITVNADYRKIIEGGGGGGGSSEDTSWSMPILSNDTQDIDGITYTITADSIHNNQKPYLAFDGIDASTLATQGKAWHSAKASHFGTHWIMLTISKGIAITSFTIKHRYTANNMENHNLKEFIFEGSNDGETWIELLHDTCIGTPATSESFSINNTTHYTQYRIREITTYSVYSYECYLVIGELTFEGLIKI